MWGATPPVRDRRTPGPASRRQEASAAVRRSRPPVDAHPLRRAFLFPQYRVRIAVYCRGIVKKSSILGAELTIEERTQAGSQSSTGIEAVHTDFGKDSVSMFRFSANKISLAASALLLCAGFAQAQTHTGFAADGNSDLGVAYLPLPSHRRRGGSVTVTSPPPAGTTFRDRSHHRAFMVER